LSLEHFLNQALSSWMNVKGPDSDIVLSSRIRLARNMDQYKYPYAFSNEEASEVIQTIKNRVADAPLLKMGEMDLLIMDSIKPLQKRVLVEKHLISPNLAELPSTAHVCYQKMKKLA